ncbi:hypothetical protein [Maricaulis sp.]|uniref:hypothetical protein n=1 Tax=Maricaulis sp. TaxID=1486257 RepID=UPI001B0CCA47|nr:hypothetical protein [Maricaulis sp.]MBO6766244.1 hypothetical protein [Maricaulis sp.]
MIEIASPVTTEASQALAIVGPDWSAWVTAGATVILAALTAVLAVVTWRLASASSQPQVVASLEPNKWSIIYLELVVQNTGNAPAFDIEVEFDPPLPRHRELKPGANIPLSHLSVLRPGQAIRTTQCHFNDAVGKKFAANISWKRHPSSSQKLTMAYEIDMGGWQNVSWLGGASPEIELAKEFKRFREAWDRIANGSRTLKVDTYTSEDRQAQIELQEEAMRRWREERGTEGGENQD